MKWPNGKIYFQVPEEILNQADQMAQIVSNQMDLFLEPYEKWQNL